MANVKIAVRIRPLTPRLVYYISNSYTARGKKRKFALGIVYLQ